MWRGLAALGALVAVLCSCGKSSPPMDGGDGTDLSDASSKALPDLSTESDDARETCDGAPDSSAAIRQELCTEMCGVDLQITCSGNPTMDLCVRNCMEQGAICTAEQSALFACVVAAGPAALECDQVTHFLVLRAGFCEMENADTVACFDATGGKPCMP
jgi:hypothetical protein